ncbi:peroxiredoxin [Amaricoccus sp.]|uniref:peroxiredoxin n=1 Tax=Amaricoccus sp. TaxID=1872485 RepID=UPI001B4B66ED|nr:peroxiredoxin [Amaricoccus sp.]MBP7002447.1 peroxiredoxin [Amaricoccus sp.]
MTLAVGDKLPSATFVEMGPEGPREVDAASVFAGRRVAFFGLPGAYTGVCSTRHIPSFIRVAPALREKGIDEIVCIAVNDPFVLGAWGEATGATEAGIRLLGDAGSDFVRAIGLEFSNPSRGFHNRSKRYAALAEDGVVKVLNVEANPGACELSGGEALLEAI